MALHPIPFPIDQPVMPEGRQIGRRSSIDALQAALLGCAHQWMIGERRTGKTSVAKAVLARLRRDGAVTIDVDLSKIRIESGDDLAAEIAGQAQAAGVGDNTAGKRAAVLARRHRREAKALASVLEALGFADEGEALSAVAGVLAGAADANPGLSAVFEALAIHARVSERRMYLLLDEVHLLANLDGAEEAVATASRLERSPVVFVLAGSEESAAQALRERGRPLAALGHEFHLAPIAEEDWLPGLRQRFAEAGIEIGEPELKAIVAASSGHPRRTMLIASKLHLQMLAMPHRTAGRELVALAISDAEDDRAWR